MPTNTLSSVTEDVKEFINGMLGAKVSVTGNNPAEVYSIAEYVSESGAVLGYVGSDLAGACRLGAALTLVPAGRADEAIKEGSIGDSLAENFYEILNVAMNLVRASNGSRVLLGRIAHGRTSEGYSELIAGLDASNRSNVCFDVPRYGACTIVVGKATA